MRKVLAEKIVSEKFSDTALSDTIFPAKTFFICDVSEGFPTHHR